MRTKKLNNKGFTLVEVIVVAVIVAVLALVAIQLYTGYVKDARANTAENLAAAAATFLQAEANRGNIASASEYTGGEDIEVGGTGPAGEFRVPEGSIVDVEQYTVIAYVGVGDASDAATAAADATVGKSGSYTWYVVPPAN